MSFHRATLDPAGLAEAKPLYAHVNVAGTDTSKTVYVAGQVGMFADGSLAPTYEGQVRQTCENVRTCLAAAGASVRDIVKVTYYIVHYDPANRPHVPIVLAFYDGHRPSTALVPVPCLAKPEILFEMDVTAVVGPPSSSLPAGVPNTGTAVPNTGTAVPNTGTAVPNTGTAVPNTGTAVPNTGTAVQDTAVDVVVVGGGLSGLQAAVDCQAAGLSALVLEARDRVGGKTWSVPGAGGRGMVELGGAWINDSNQARAYALARRLGLDFVQQRTTGDCVMQDLDGAYKLFEYGGVPPHAPAEAANMVAVRTQIEALCHELDLYDVGKHPSAAAWDAVTLDEFVTKTLGGGPTALATARTWTRGMLGCEPREMSALFFLDYVKSGGGLLQIRSDMKHGGQFLRMRQGAQSLSTGLAGLLQPGSVRLNAAVRSIATDATGTTVTTEDGRRFRARRVIVSVPTPLYKEIAFDPPLPADKQALVAATTLGWTAKTVLCYDAPFWRSSGFSGLVSSFDGCVNLLRDTSSDQDGHFSLTCFHQGDPGRAWALLSSQQRRDAVVAHVGRAFANPSAAAAHTGAYEQIWFPERWSQGCPCPVMGPNLLAPLGHALRSAAGALHFVGTETAYEWKGYMEGALRAGTRGADEVISALRPSTGRL